ncbi:TonB-dependent receptor [Ideonella sp. YS5]|uniref:TonB-dependent receptor n=1 Tax=Ideonella sp. YS5 TaxID=3453714 RepID=UPI003EEEEF41
MRAVRGPRPAFHRLAHAAWLALALSPLSQAQTPASSDEPEPGKPQRIEITGSAIKRLPGETALPVQVLTREDIVKAGVTTAAEIVGRLSAAATNLTDGISIAAGGYRDQMGFNAANLRGVGVSSTLVLLNGRRMANFASPGDDAGVDLNNIPAAAIEKVEVLLDGASAIYGSDAIAGVINFITRRDFQGVELDAYYGDTQEGGGGKRTASVAAGIGDYGADGYNLMAVLDIQKTDRLASPQRKFIQKLDIPGRLPYLLLSRTFPANIDISDEQLQTLNDHGFLLNGHALTETRFNLSWPDCNPPANLNLPGGIGGAQGCTYNFMGDVELYPKTDKQSLLTRGVFNLGGGHQLFGEASYSQATSYYVALPAPFTPDIDLSVTHVDGLSGFGLEQTDPIISARLRFTEAGRQSSELVSTGQRYLVGANGSFGAWDYEAALNHSSSTVSDRAFHGYLNEAMIDEGLADGRINPFGPSSAEGQALIAQAQITGEVRRATGEMNAVDFKLSRSLTRLGGGDLGLALGGEYRTEKQSYHQSQALADDLILGEISQGPDADFSYSRKVAAVWSELDAPVTKELDLQFAVRYERYQRTGGATSPKVGLRYQPTSSLVLRASAGAGFHAPSMTDLYRPTTEYDGALLFDPGCPDDFISCTDTWRVRTYSNPNLKPEKSRQFSFGAVFEPSKGFNASLDYWNIEKRDLISKLGSDVILANLDKYGDLVHRDEDGYIEYIELRKDNRGKQKASGIDISLAWSGLKTDWGTWGAHLNGTLTLTSKEQLGDGDPFVSNLGKFVEDGAVQRWRHTVGVDWEYGAFAASLSNSYLSSYVDQNNAPDENAEQYVKFNRVKAYSLWDVQGSWQATPALTLRAGVKNLLDTPPPFSNQAYFYLSGYDPSYTDPRGRFYYLSAQYRFQ